MRYLSQGLAGLLFCIAFVPVAADQGSRHSVPESMPDNVGAGQDHFEALHRLAARQSRAGSSTASILGGGPVTVGPDPDCDYDSLQIAINDAMVGLHDGDILVHIDYTRTSEYDFSNSASWQSNFRIIGGADSCVPELADIVGRTTLDAGGSGRLFDIAWQASESDPFRSVELRNFELINGGNVSFGGGVYIRGRGGRLSVELQNVEIRDSNAGLAGGGIQLTAFNDTIVDSPGEDVPPLLYLDDDSHVIGNSAGTGGGIACQATQTTPPQMIHLRTGAGLIGFNEAAGGGGLSISRCRAELRNGGPVNFLLPLGGIFANSATGSGGGLLVNNSGVVALTSISGDEFGGDPDSAVRIFGNTAARGGGISIEGDGSGVSAINAVIFNNSAEFSSSDPDPGSTGRGGGIYMSNEANFFMQFIEGVVGRCIPPYSDSGVQFEPPCNRIVDNSAERHGGGIYVSNASVAAIFNAYFEGNAAGETNNGSALFAGNDSGFTGSGLATAYLTNVLISNHEQGRRVVYAGSDSDVRLQWATLADNTYPAGGALLRSFAGSGLESTLWLIGSVAWPDPHSGGTMLTSGGTGSTEVFVDCMIGFDTQGELQVDGVDFYSQIDPEFTDSAGNNYRPGATSPAIDYCSDFRGPPSFDLDAAPRGLPYQMGATTPAPNPEPGGTYDLGAWAGARVDGVFTDRFEQP